MIDFKMIELEDKAWMDRLIQKENSRSADFNFNNFYLWKDSYKTMVACRGERLIARIFFRSVRPVYFFPAGSGDLEEVLGVMEEDARRYGARLSLWGITREKKALLETLFPGRFAFAENRASFDYVYELDRLAELPGKAFHGKRNHIRRFQEAHDWRFVPVTAGNLEECWEMNQAWAREKRQAHAEPNPEERNAIRRAISHYSRLGLEGGLLKAEEKIVAFTIGERQSSDTYVIHFEKAFSGIQGAYPMINREFARYIRSRYPDVIYVNREDDMGLENLRKAKESYHPAFLVEKYTARQKTGPGV